MSDCQAYDLASNEGGGIGGNPIEEPMVIARLPDISRSHSHKNDHEKDRKKSKSSPAEAIVAFPRQWPALTKKVIGATVAVVLLVVCWLIFAGSSDPESLRPAPPAAAAPETPLWNGKTELGETEPKTVIASKVSRPSAKPIKLDEVLSHEVLSHGVLSHGVLSHGVPSRRTPREKPAGGSRPLVIGTPVPPKNVAANDRDWATLSESEYYWAVRRRSESDTCRTAAKPNSGLSSQHPAGRQTSEPGAAPEQTGKARLNGVIETPTVRVY